jgi:ATP-dependent helicase HrpB
VVEAPPGSGKSTRLPLWCEGLGRVLVVEPRRLACRSLARYVAQLRGTSPGELVGYAIRFETVFGGSTRVIFATPGVALRWYSEGGLREFDAAILDEFHERRWDTDLLAALLHADGRRFALASATVEGERLARFFGAARIEARGRMHPVQVSYSEQDGLPRAKGLEKRVSRGVSHALQQIGSGDVLVFLPGKGEIRAARDQLRRERIRQEVVELHASAEQEAQDRALNPPASGTRIVLSTNVAETSVTLPGVRAVVDSGLERRTHHRGGRTVLGLCAVSQAAADQRKGRAGRLGPGTCLRLWGRSARLEPYTPPETVREDPSEFVLAAAACGRPVETLACPDPPPQHALERARARLLSMGAIDGEGRITEHGLHLFPLPLDTQLAHLIAAMPDAETQAAMTDLAAALSAGGFILSPRQSDKARERLLEWAPEPCDACTLIRLVRSDPPPEIGINPAPLREARKLAERIRTAQDIYRPGTEAPPHRRLVQAIARAVPELAFVRRSKRRWSMGNGSEEVVVGSGTRLEESQEAAVVLDRHSVPSRGTTGTQTIATCLAPISLAQIAEAGLGSVAVRDPEFDGERITARLVREYAGRTVESRAIEPEGPELRQAVVDLLLSGHLWPELGERLQEDVRAWNLYIRLGFGQGRETDLRSWLLGRLEAIGVEHSEDLHLLEPDDFSFDGVPEWERADFDRRYPRHLSLENLELEVEYEPQRRRITLVKTSGIRKAPPKRWELPAWGRGWTLQFRDGSRVVPLD